LFQVVTQPHYYQLQQIQQQPNIVQQGGTKIVMQGGQPMRYSFVQKPQQPQQVQQIAVQQNQVGQLMQLNQQPQQIQAQGVPRQFTPRMLTSSTPMRIRVQSPGIQQQSQVISVVQQRPRAPKQGPRVVRPTAQNALHQQQVRPAQQGNKIIYIVQTQPDGSQVLVPHSQYNQPAQPQPQQVVQMVRQKVVQKSPAQTQYQATEMNQQQPSQSQQLTDATHAPTTSTFTPKKDGDCDDLEDSITATAISKSARSEPPPLAAQSGVTMTMEEARKRGIQPNPSRVGVVRPIMNTAGNQLRSPTRNPALQVIRQRPPPRPQFQQPGLNQELEVPERESAKMLVILDNGEQRLITFTLPKETCTVQELLDQVGIHVGADSNIECIENPGSEIDYIVKVGNFASRDTAAMTKAAENHIRQQQQRQQMVNNQRSNILQHQQQQVVQQSTAEIAKSKSPELKLPPPKYVNGFFALCQACGFSGSDHAKCERCHRIFTEDPKMVKMTNTVQKGNNLTLQGIATATQTQKAGNNRAGTLDKKDQIEALQKKHQIATARQNSGRGRGGLMATSRGGRSPRAPRKPALPEVVTLSSDDESDSEGSKSSSAKALAEKKEEKVLPKKYFEPDIVEDVVAGEF
jgi:sentrin-specific protease 7